ncbi:hypothetical protein APT63_11485 [Pseudomonas sp. 22-AL-CL-001]|nr:hypothetical protein APT63_11485 [Pseudomonas monteilii]
MNLVARLHGGLLAGRVTHGGRNGRLSRQVVGLTLRFGWGERRVVDVRIRGFRWSRDVHDRASQTAD